MKYLAILCRAWEKMAVAEETTSSESYLEAAELFEQAKEHCYTKKASLWALGNSNFCRGLAAGVEYQIILDVYPGTPTAEQAPTMIAETYVEWAAALKEGGDPEAAIARYQAVSTAYPDTPAGQQVPVLIAETYAEWAAQLLDAGLRQEAFQKYESLSPSVD